MTRAVAVPCPVCGEDRPSPWGEERGWRAVRCGACGVVYTSPRPAPEAISEAATLGQHQVEAGVMDVVGAFSAKKVKGLGDRLDVLWAGAQAPWQAGRDGRRAPCTWLDVGAGFGELVMAVGKRLAPAVPGDEVRGIEPCLPKVERACALGLDVRAQGLSDVRREGGWGVVSLVNVLSHLPEPHGFFAEVAELVRPGGEVLLVTGNGGDIERADYPQELSLPDHLLFAGERHVRRVLEGAGLVVDKLLRFETALPRPAWEAALEGAAAAVLRRRVGYSRTPFRSLWVRARRPVGV